MEITALCVPSLPSCCSRPRTSLALFSAFRKKSRARFSPGQHNALTSFCAGSWTGWALWVPFSPGYSVIVCEYRLLCLARHPPRAPIGALSQLQSEFTSCSVIRTLLIISQTCKCKRRGKTNSKCSPQHAELSHTSLVLKHFNGPCKYCHSGVAFVFPNCRRS